MKTATFNLKSYDYVIVLFLIIVFSFSTKAWRISKPQEYYFDEIYYGFTAEQYSLGNMDAWVYDTSAPKGFSYTWDHPPTGKLLMSVPIKIFGISSLSRRIIPLISGTALTLVSYVLSLTLFPKNKLAALLSALIVSLDGLVLTMSRIALVDVILTLFVLCSVLFLWKKSRVLSALFFGLAISTKWTGVYVLPVMFLYEVLTSGWPKRNITSRITKVIFAMFIYVSIGAAIYLLSYLPLILHFGWDKFVDLQKQMYWYHTGLKATHPSQSMPYTWPLDIRPVWVWVKWRYGIVQNIYVMGNPFIFWGGVVAVLSSLVQAIRTRSKNLIILLFSYFIFWLPWIFSPRLMFLYHYLPSVPFLVICLSFILSRMVESGKSGRVAALLYVISIIYLFGYFYPYWTGLPMDRQQAEQYVWFKTWK